MDKVYTQANTYVSDVIKAYLNDGYTLDVFYNDPGNSIMYVLFADEHGIRCKTVITLTDIVKTDDNYSCTFHKVDYVGSEVFSDERRTFKSGYKCKVTDKHTSADVDNKDKSEDCTCNTCKHADHKDTSSNKISKDEVEDDLVKLVRMLFSK